MSLEAGCPCSHSLPEVLERGPQMIDEVLHPALPATQMVDQVLTHEGPPDGGSGKELPVHVLSAGNAL